MIKANLRGGEASAAALWDEVLGEVDFFLTSGGDVPREGDDTLPERSSDVTDLLALWELSDRSLKTKQMFKTMNVNAHIQCGVPWRLHTVPALFLLLFVFLCISSSIFPFLLLLLRLLLVFVLAFVFLPDDRNVQRDWGRRTGGTGPFLFTVATF